MKKRIYPVVGTLELYLHLWNLYTDLFDKFQDALDLLDAQRHSFGADEQGLIDGLNTASLAFEGSFSQGGHYFSFDDLVPGIGADFEAWMKVNGKLGRHRAYSSNEVLRWFEIFKRERGMA
jgi:hypothetical protein